jgi:hypothetical protein
MPAFAILLLLLLPIAPATAHDWAPNTQLLTGPAFPRCHMGLGRIWKSDQVPAGPVHIRMRNTDPAAMRITWQAEVRMPREGTRDLGGGSITIPPYEFAVADTVGISLGNLTGSRITVTILSCAPA